MLNISAHITVKHDAEYQWMVAQQHISHNRAFSDIREKLHNNLCSVKRNFRWWRSCTHICVYMHQMNNS
jgi:hypothetical protein